MREFPIMKHAKTNELFLFVSVAIIQNFDGGIHDETTPLKKLLCQGAWYGDPQKDIGDSRWNDSHTRCFAWW